MRRSTIIGGVLVSLALGTPAAAMDRYGQIGDGNHNAIVDPDKAIERLAAASSTVDRGHGKSTRGMRGILRDDPYLQAAFASLDNK